MSVSVGEPMRAAVCTGRYTCTELRGGIHLGTNEGSCSAAFGGVRGSTVGVWTAGHCANAGQEMTHGSVPIGKVSRQQLFGEIDALFVPEVSLALSVTNKIYDSEQNREYPVLRLFPSAVSHTGIFVARSGITTGRQTGTVINTNASYYLVGNDGSRVLMTNQSMVSGCALPGDSGGPVYRFSEGIGIVSSSNFVRDGLGDPVCRTTGAEYGYTKLDVALSGLGGGILTR